MFDNISDAVKWIETIKRKDKRTDLFRIKRVLDDFNNPQLEYKKIHVAGTNGKGSVSSYLNYGLINDYKIGLFTSPYIVKFNERVIVDNKCISDNDLLNYANIMYKYCTMYTEKYNDVIPFFEVVFVIALLYFKDQNIDVAIIEVGVGGLLDATNIINADYSIITNIGYDHVNSLGTTLQEIASHKLGIVKDNNKLITIVDDKLHKQFIEHCNKNNSTIEIINKDDIKDIKLTLNNTTFTYDNYKFGIPLVGKYQAYNAILAIILLKRMFSFSYDKINEKLKNTIWMARFEVLSNNPLTIIDGAHNVDGICGLVDNCNEILKNKKIHVCFTAMSDKDTMVMINKLSSVAYTMNFTRFEYGRVSDLNTLVGQSHFKGGNTYSFNEVDDCITDVFKRCKDDEVILFTGSLYFAGLVRKKIIDLQLNSK